LIYAVDALGPSCHTGAETCFFRVLGSGEPVEATLSVQHLMGRLETELEARKESSAGRSYTKSLLDGGAAAIGAKLREEASELAVALDQETDDRVAKEAADLVYHALVGLRWRGVAWRAVLEVLNQRMGTSGHVEKASRKPSGGASDA
jgi:phosphoribosyl-ATP pyrophosphohydrolase/phosphoribosyl-AMP cyclohydrolase